MRFAWITLCLIWVPLLAAAQDSDRQVGFLAGFLESRLSDDSQQVQVDGLEGALSSRATVERLTISDRNGPWLVIDEAVLDWDRAAVLRGDIQIRSLAAARIAILRRPMPTAQPGIEAAAQPFTLPDLPVAIAIDAVSAPLLELGPGVLTADSPALALSVSGSASLQGGGGQLNLDATTLARPISSFETRIAFDPTDRTLAIDLALTEDEDGLIGDLLGLPGGPSLDLTVQGRGPLSDFAADLALGTDGVPRLTGRFRTDLQPGDQAQVFDAALQGDLTPLLTPDLHPFFGTDLRITAQGTRLPSGAIGLEAFSATTAALTARGQLTLDATGWPSLLALDITAARADGSPLRLPLPGAPVQIDRGQITLDYDAAEADRLQFAARLTGVETSAGTLAVADLTLDGPIDPAAKRFAFQTRFAAEGLQPSDANLAAALRPDLILVARASGGTDRALQIDDLALTNGDLSLTGRASLQDPMGGLTTDLDLQVAAPSITRFSTLLGRALSGAVEGRLNGTATLLSGAFDLTLEATARDLQVGIDQVDRLLDGPSQLRLAARRDDTGLLVRAANFSSDHARLTGDGQIGGGTTRAQLDGRLNNIARLVPGFPGAATARVEINGPSDGPLAITGRIAAANALTAQLRGSASPTLDRVDLDLTGQSDLALANPFIGNRRVTGAARFDLTTRGAPDPANLGGTVSLQNVSFADPDLPISLVGGTGQLALASGQMDITYATQARDGGTGRLSGRLGLAAPFAANLQAGFDRVVLRQGDVLQTDLSGAVAVDGPLTAGALVSGAITLGTTEIRLATLNQGQSSPLEGVRHVGEPAGVRATRALAGFVADGSGTARSSSPLALDVTLSAPNQIFIRGRGLDAEMGGSLRVRGTTQDLQPEGQFSLLRGRLDLLGRRLTLDEGAVVLQGDFDPRVRLLAAAQSTGIDIQIALEGPASAPALTLTSQPSLPQDEALARFLFGRGLAQLSPLQAAQLATALVSLTGDGSPGVLDRLRAATGLDDFDIGAGSGSDGPAVRAGKYLSDNVYSDVVIGADGRGEVTLNLDVTPSLTLRGSADNEGGTGLGLFFERDY